MHKRAPRIIALALVVGLALLGLGLLAASLLPTAQLAGRLLGAAGEADRGGTHTQDLLAHFGERLRFAGVCSLVLASAGFVFRHGLATLVCGPWRFAFAFEWRGVLAISVFGLVLRLVFVSVPMRYDEALTFNELASRPLYYGLSYYPDPNNHLLNTLLVHVAYVVLGNREWVIRLPALLAGTLLAPATYWLTRMLAEPRDSKAAAVLAGTLAAASSYLIDYSTNSRGYTLQALCFVVMLALVLRPTPRRLFGAAIVAALGAYALPTMLYGVAVAAVWLLVAIRQRPRWVVLGGTVTLLGALVFVMYLPVILISGPESLASNRFVVPLDAATLAWELPRTLASTWALWNRDIAWPLAAVLAIGFAAGVVFDVRALRVPLGLLAPAVCLVLVLAQRVAPFERVWLFLLPLYFALAALGLLQLVGRFAKADVTGYAFAALAAVVMAAGVLTSDAIRTSGETGVFPDAPLVAEALRGRLSAEDAVVTELPASLPQLQYYFPRAGLPTETLVRDPTTAARAYAVVPPSATPTVPGWRPAGVVQSFATADLVALER